MQAESGFTGQETVTFRATDPTGAIAEDTILVTVIPINDPPVVTSLPPLVVRFDVPYRFDLTPYVTDSDTPVGKLVVTTSNPSNVTVDGLVLILVYPPRLGSLAWPYVTPLTVAVSDGDSVAAATTTVTVTDDYPPVLLSHLPNVTFPEDTVKLQAFDLDDYFLDTDGLVQLTARTTNVTVNIRTDHSVDFGALTNWSGRQAVVFRATDNRGAIAEDTMYVTVLPVNDAPVILPIPKQVHDGLGSWVLDLTPFLRDSDNVTGDVAKQVERRYGKTFATGSGYVSEIEGIRLYLESFFGAKAAMVVRKRDDKSDEPPRQVEGEIPPPLMPQ